MPIRELTHFRITCDACGQHVDYWAVNFRDGLPEGWSVVIDEPQYWYQHRAFCPTCREEQEQR